jgi:hypothetical protein
MGRELPDELRDTVDYIAIRRLHDAYADIVNRRAWTELDEVFAPSAIVVVDKRDGAPLELTGPETLGAFIGAAIEQFEFFEFVLLNMRVFLHWQGDADRAAGRVYINEVRHGETGGWSTAYGLYQDHYVRVDDHWCIARRRYHSLARTSRDFDVFEHPSDELT